MSPGLSWPGLPCYLRQGGRLACEDSGDLRAVHPAIPGGLWVRVDRRRLLFAIQKGRCAYCRCKLYIGKARPHPRLGTLEHVRPRVLGGADDLMNIVLACHACNRLKGGREPNEAERMAHSAVLMRLGSILVPMPAPAVLAA